MLFNSFAFAVFLPTVFIFYWLLPHRFRWILILLSSYYFYMSWNIEYVFLIFFTTFISYSAALLIEKAERKAKKIILSGCAVLCIGVLFFFKYFNFISQSVAGMLDLFSIKLHPLTLKLLLPVGISFYTFQTLSYVIDVYRGDTTAEKHFGKYAAFISFFPQLVAGPIERSNNLLRQINAEHSFDYAQASYGLKLMAWGYFKKVMVADTLSKYVGLIFDYPMNYTGFSLVLATLFFSIQIYCDFSGYSDIAIGASKLFGINLMTNFKSPYFSQSVQEFWSRWHISLSTWFRDYVYIPLGGNRVSKLRHHANTILTFLVSGLWHGADWTFVIWGSIHGIAQVFENIFACKKRKKFAFNWWIRALIVYAFCSFAWIFFVSSSVGDAFYVISRLFDDISSPISYLRTGIRSVLSMGKADLVFLSVSLFILFLYDLLSLKKDVIKLISTQKAAVRWSIYCLFAVWMVVCIPANYSSEFIYFQF